MKPLYTDEQYNSSKSIDKLPFECECCNNTYFKPKKEITYAIKNKKNIKFCSFKCHMLFKTIKQLVKCQNCHLEFLKSGHEIRKRPNHFCSYSCSATYHNSNKKYGTKRSKLERFLEQQLIILYPNLKMHFNRKDAIGSELDIYIPSLNIAFELNGIFHYEPIYGIDKLQKIQENDQNKFKLCQENKVDLCIIDTSGQKYFKESTSKKYLDIIIGIINNRIC